MAIRQSRGITLGKGTPQRLEGQNGDITIRSSRKGLKLYVKESNKWHSVDLGINLRQIASTVRKLEDEVKRLSTKTNNTPVVDKLLLRQSGGTSAVGIQNKSGNIAFRNSTDTSDAIVLNPKIKGSADGSDSNPVIDTQTSNRIKLAYNDDSSNFVVRLIHAASGSIQSMLSFFNGASAKWSIGYSGDESSVLKIAAAANLDSPIFEFASTGDLTLKAPNDSSAKILLQSDNSDDAGDDWTITANTNQRLTIGNDIASAGTPASFLTIVPHATASSSSVSVPGSFSATTLDVDGIAKYKHTTFNTAGPTDGIDVSDTTVLEVDTSSNNVIIGGFSNGVQGQILHIVKTDTTNFIQLEHNETPAAGSHQKIFLTSGSDERVVGYGGYTLYCNGASWFSLSNPTGAADAG